MRRFSKNNQINTICAFLIILCVFAVGINLTRACGDHPIKYVLSQKYNEKYSMQGELAIFAKY